MNRIFLRADANKEIGLGHLSRTLALAEMLGPEQNFEFLIRSPSKAIKQMIRPVCEIIHELDEQNTEEEPSFIQGNFLQGDDIIVLDGYEFKTEYQEKIKEKGNHLVCIDDLHDWHFVADLVINHAPGVTTESYSAEPYTKFALGTDFALLRKVYQKQAKQKKHITAVETAFTCFGGSDPWNATLIALQALAEITELKTIHVVCGETYQHIASLEQLMKKLTLSQVKLHRSLDADAMSVLMSESDIAICPASTVAYEMISCKAGLAITCLVDNQADIYKGLLDKEAASAVGDMKNMDSEHLQPILRKLMSPDLVNEMMDKQARLIDGKAPERLRKILQDLKILHTLD